METFKNDTYKVEATRSAGCKLAMKVFVSGEATRKAYKVAVKRVNKQISVPGFRKGKAPDETIISKYGSYVDQEWKDILIHDAVDQGLALSKIYPMKRGLDSRPKIGLCSVEEGAEVFFSYEHYPIVPEIDFSVIKLPEFKKNSIGQKEIDTVLQEVQKAYADWEEIKEERGNEGDYATVTVHTLDPEIALINDRRVPIDKNNLTPWLYNAIITMKKGEVKEIPQENQPEKKLRITLHAFWKILLPEVNEELAKKCGAASLEDLYAKIRHNLEQEAEAELKERKLKALDDYLLEHYKFDIPESLLEYDRENRLKEQIAQLKAAGSSDAEITAKQQQLEQIAAEVAEKSMRLFFLRQRIRQQGNIDVTQQDLQDEVAHEMRANPLFLQHNMNQLASQKLVSTLRDNVVERKTKEYALSQLELTH